MQPIIMAGAWQTMLAEAGSRTAAGFAGFARSAAPAAVGAVWQGALVAVALVLCLRLLPRVSAGHRFAIWASAFAAVAALPFLVHSSAMPSATVKPWLQLDGRWALVVAALWLAASALRGADLVFHSLRLRRLWKNAASVQVEPNLRSLLATISPTSHSVEVCTTHELDRPSVIGFLAPRILIPDWLLERLTPGELEHVILHEVEHLRRRDDWTNLLQKFFLVLFPLNPALAWMERRLCREREMACDEGVVHRTQAPRAYAACLTNLAERSLKRRTQMLSLGAFERRPELVHRVHSILWRGSVLHPLAARAWIGAVCCGLLLGAVEMARSPQMVGFVQATPGRATHDVASASATPAARATLHAASSPVHNTEAASASATFLAASDLNATSRFRAVETKAIMAPRRSENEPEAGSMMAASERPSPERSPRAIERNAPGLEVSGAPHQVRLKAETPSSAAAAAPAHEPKMVLLTEWEQVDTLQGKSRQMADYDTGAGDPQQNADARNQQAEQPPAQITVTRVILTIYRVSPALKATKRHAAVSNSGESAAVPFDGGWLVFEL
jgi:beta-lactamase regulating signal transducer with metallopeptidase domain